MAKIDIFIVKFRKNYQKNLKVFFKSLIIILLQKDLRPFIHNFTHACHVYTATEKAIQFKQIEYND